MKPIHKGESYEMRELDFGGRFYCFGSRRRMKQFARKRINRLRRRVENGMYNLILGI